VASLPLVLATTLACERSEEPKPLTSGDEPPEAETTNPMVSPEIAEAVAKANQASTAVNTENAPPENGILGPDRAQLDAPTGTPPKVVLGKAGDEPRLALGGVELADDRIGQMTLMVRTGPNTGMPSVSLKFELSKEAANKESPLPVGATAVGVEIVDASLAPEQMGEVPPEVGGTIATLKGSTLHYVSQGGALLGDTGVELGKKTDERVGALLAAMSDVFRLVLLSTPKEPVGKGGFWMVTQRERLSLGEVVGYHLVTVANVEEGRVTLNINTKRYLVNPEFQGMPAMQFLGTATTDLVVIPGQHLPLEGRTQYSLQAMVQREGSQPRPLMFDVRALFVFPPKDSAAATPKAGGAAPQVGGAAPKGTAQ
jgi:hypothetical protein